MRVVRETLEATVAETLTTCLESFSSKGYKSKAVRFVKGESYSVEPLTEMGGVKIYRVEHISGKVSNMMESHVKRFFNI
jgi:hypothetical protein